MNHLSLILTSYQNQHAYYQKLKNSFKTFKFNDDDDFVIRNNIDNNKILLLEDLSLPFFERFIANSKSIVSCHAGFITHITGSNKTKCIDIVDEFQKTWVDCWVPKNTKYERIYKSELPLPFRSISEKLIS